MARGSRGELDILVGAHLRRLRENAGMSGEQVASALDVSQQLVSEQESGRKRLSIAQLLKLAALYGKTLAQLIAEMELDCRAPTHFADGAQAAYRADTTERGSAKAARQPFLIDLDQLDDPAERKAVLDLFNRFKERGNDGRRSG